MKSKGTVMASRTLESIFDPLSPAEKSQLLAIEEKRGENTDFSEIPPLPEGWFRRAKPLAEAFPKLAEAIQEIREHRERQAAEAKVVLPETVDAAQVRERLGLTQREFANRFGLSVHTIRQWESGKRKPESAALALLLVIAYSADTVTAALKSPPSGLVRHSRMGPAKRGRPSREKQSA